MAINGETCSSDLDNSVVVSSLSVSSSSSSSDWNLVFECRTSSLLDFSEFFAEEVAAGALAGDFFLEFPEKIDEIEPSDWEARNRERFDSDCWLGKRTDFLKSCEIQRLGLKSVLFAAKSAIITASRCSISL